MTDHELYEQLAAIEHTRWSHWQKYLHTHCARREPDGSLTIPAVYVQHWEQMINTPYQFLTETEKASDREQVDRYWHLIRSHFRPGNETP